MMMRPFLVFVFLVSIIAACSNNPQQEQTVKANNGTAGNTTLPLNLTDVDKIEFFFYPDPAEQKKYTRLVVSDTARINVVRNNLMQDTSSHNECPHDAKMFLFRNGEVFKTIYGATAAGCRYFAYAINSKPHYIKMGDSAVQLLEQLRKESK